MSVDAGVTALIPLPVLLPLLGAAVTLLAARSPAVQRGVSVVALTGVLGCAVALMVVTGRDGAQVVTVGAWPTGVGIALVADRLSSLMLATSATVTLLVMLFSVGQGAAADREADTGGADGPGTQRLPISVYHPTFLVLSAGVSIAFLAGDLFNLFVGFEVLLAASYVLLTLGGTGPRVAAGTTYVLVALASSFIFLAGVGLVYAATGTLAMADLPARLATLPAPVALALQLVLLVAFGIKAAIFPLSAWLPDSYPTAPAPVTAIFAGLLTKVGVYAIFRTRTLLFPGGSAGDGTDALSMVLLVLALATMVVGALGAIVQSDLKRVLSFTLVSHIGYMIFGIALGSQLGLSGAIFYVVHHIVIQTALFLVSGLVEARAGTTSVERLGGLAAAAPWLGLLYLIPALNLAGIPPFSGFVGKLVLLRAGVDEGGLLPWALVVGAVVTALLTLLAMARVWGKAFWSGLAPGQERPSGAGSATATRRVPAGAVVPTVGAVAVTLVLTVGAGPLYAYASATASDVLGDGYRAAVAQSGQDASTVREEKTP